MEFEIHGGHLVLFFIGLAGVIMIASVFITPKRPCASKLHPKHIKK